MDYGAINISWPYKRFQLFVLAVSSATHAVYVCVELANKSILQTK